MTEEQLTEMYQWLTNELRDYFSMISRQYGMTYDQYLLLKEIEKRGKSQGSNLAEIFGISRAAVSRRCRELLKMGYIQRYGGQEPDFRVTHFGTTEEGENVILKLNDAYEEWFKELEKDFGKADFEKLLTLSERFHQQSQMKAVIL
jgi:DNA-binding MarR family transcriptional regulator